MTKPIVAIVGKPNVGKSTIFNRVVGERVSIVEDTPGVTRDRIYSSGEWLTHEFNIIDTGGIEIGDAPFQTQIRAQAEIAIDEACYHFHGECKRRTYTKWWNGCTNVI